jgi:hypothetical protein
VAWPYSEMSHSTTVHTTVAWGLDCAQQQVYRVGWGYHTSDVGELPIAGSEQQPAPRCADLVPVALQVVMGGGQDASQVTTTAAKAGGFEARFFHKVREGLSRLGMHSALRWGGTRLGQWCRSPW